jgi:tetratricopeptide (TPR) repeat protein
MPRLRWSLTFACMSLFAANIAFAQQGGPIQGLLSEIQGAVTSEDDNRPIQNAKVQLKTEAGQVVTSTFTGQDGRFAFRNLAKGNYVVTITVDGYETDNQKVMIVGFNVPEVRMALKKGAKLEDKTTPAGGTVSSRELMLPQKAQEAMHKGMERLYKKNDPPGSVPFFQKVLTLAPGFYEAYYQEGMAYTYESKLADAETAFKKAMTASDDKYPDPCFGMAAILSDQERFKEAEGFSRHGLELQPEAARGHFELARALFGEGRTAQAQESAVEARRLNPTFSPLYVILANIHLQLHNDAAVVEDLGTYLKLDPSGPFAPQARDLKEKTEKMLSHKGAPPVPNLN